MSQMVIEKSLNVQNKVKFSQLFSNPKLGLSVIYLVHFCHGSYQMTFSSNVATTTFFANNGLLLFDFKIFIGVNESGSIKSNALYWNASLKQPPFTLQKSIWLIQCLCNWMRSKFFHHNSQEAKLWINFTWLNEATLLKNQSAKFKWDAKLDFSLIENQLASCAINKLSRHSEIPWDSHESSSKLSHQSQQQADFSEKLFNL